MKTFGEKILGVEYKERKAAYALIFEEGNIALIRTSKGYFLPGGGIEENETEEESLHRELREETGWQIRILRHLSHARQYFYAASEGIYFDSVASFFLAEKIDGGTGIIEEADHQLCWCKPQDILLNITHAYQAWAVEIGWSDMLAFLYCNNAATTTRTIQGS